MTAPGTNNHELSDLDTILHILSNERRRRALRHACEEGETTTGELADKLAQAEVEKHPHKVRSQERKRVYIALYQSHLPKMADADLITYQNHTVKPQQLAHQIWSPLQELEAIVDDTIEPTSTSGLGLREKLHHLCTPGGDPA